MADKKWKTFERLVAAIHIAEQQGATVTWNEKINGRQFDVTIRFKFGLYEYLTVIECKDYTEAVPVEKVEAFITKSKDVGSHKAIMVSSSGYQSGVRDVARRHNVELYSLKTVDEVPEHLLADELIPSLSVYNIGFIPRKGKEILLSEENNVLLYLLLNIKVLLQNSETSPQQIIQKFTEKFTERTLSRKPRKAKIPLPKGTKIIFPDTEKEIYVSSLFLTYKLISIPKLKEEEVASYFIRPSYKFENELTGDATIINPAHLKLGFDTKLEVGKYYHNPKLGFSYYCESIIDVKDEDASGGKVIMFLVESYQDGVLFQARLRGSREVGSYLVEVTNKKEIERLSKMYQKIVDMEQKEKTEQHERKTQTKPIRIGASGIRVRPVSHSPLQYSPEANTSFATITLQVEQTEDTDESSKSNERSEPRNR